MLKVALTGNIAAGKSTVARAWRSRGANIVEADELARRAVEPGTEALRQIVERWGESVLMSSGELDRAALRDVVFRDPGERRRLEEIIHPEVRHLQRVAYEEAEQEGQELIVADIPLLFETGREKDFDVVVLVDAPAEFRKQRLVENRGLSPDEAQRMIDAQWPADRKRPLADIVIENSGTVAELEARADEVWATLQLQARAGRAGR